MSARLELDDLPPRYRAQAEEIRKWKRLAEQAGKDSSWEKAGQGCQHSTGRASRMQ